MYGINEAGMTEVPEGIEDLAQAETLTPAPPQQDLSGLEQLSGQNSEQAMGPNPQQEASQQQEQLGALLGG
jgi:hypothetical protein